jgi:hypothetical protein
MYVLYIYTLYVLLYILHVYYITLYGNVMIKLFYIDIFNTQKYIFLKNEGLEGKTVPSRELVSLTREKI